MIQYTKGRIIVKVDLTSKDSYGFGKGQILTPFKNTNQFDRRIYAVTNAIVISAENICEGAEVLLEHNSVHDTNRIFEYKDNNPDIQYFSVPEMECYVWRNYNLGARLFRGDEWQPTKYYAIGERVFKPYKGALQNISPERIKNTLLIKTGEFKNKIVHTLRNSDYVIIYQDTDGKPAEILTTFHVPNDDELSFYQPYTNEQLSVEELLKIRNYAKQEIVAVDEYLTEQWLSGELYTGLTNSDCKSI